MESSTVYEFPPMGNFKRSRNLHLDLKKFVGVSLAILGIFLLIVFKFHYGYFAKNSNAFIEGRIFQNQSLINLNKSENIQKVFENSSNEAQNLNKDCARSPLDEEFVKTLSQDELIIVEQVKNEIVPSLITTFCEVNSEINIVRWLTRKNWDIEDTEKAILSTLQWRKEYRVDELFTEDLKYFEEAFLIYTDGQDYTGRNVITMDLSSVDIRKIMLAGKGKQLLRYYTRIAEFAMKYTREAQMKGLNVTQAVVIANIHGFNMEQHGCDQCMSFLRKFLYVVDAHYPGAFYKIFFINTPAEFEWILDAVKFILSSDISETLEIYGTTKKEWQEVILKLIPANQIRPHFGGTKKTVDDEQI